MVENGKVDFLHCGIGEVSLDVFGNFPGIGGGVGVSEEGFLWIGNVLLYENGFAKG